MTQFGFTKKQLKMIEVIVLLNAMALSILLPTAQSTGEIPSSHDTTALGTWYNFPSSCPTQDSCELFYNTTNRIPLSEGNNTVSTLSGYIVHLTVGCVSLSSSSTAFLQLQYAIYGNFPSSQIVATNLTNWQNIGIVSIGNNNPIFANCLNGNAFFDTYVTGNDFTLNSTSAFCNGTDVSCGYIFRVLGENGGGVGDNPRFSFIGIGVAQSIQRVETFQLTSTTTTLSYRVVTNFPVSVNTLLNFYWFATNLTGGSARCGNSGGKDFHCWEANNGSCTMASANTLCPSSGTNSIVYGTAFTGTVRAFMTGNSVPPVATLPFTTLTMFSTQSVTV